MIIQIRQEEKSFLKLPLDEGEEHFAEVLDYWAECLQEIVTLLKGAEWYIHIDDADITEQFDFPG